MNKRKDPLFKKDLVYTIKKDDSDYIINESYFYKTEPYYIIVKNENDGIRTIPASGEVLDAYIVPICLEKAKLAGIPVCDWVISYQYVSVPAIIYGLNYFSTPSDYFVVSDIMEARKVVKHVTNHGKYPFCYQKIGSSSSVTKCVSIFGNTTESNERFSALVEKTYKVFRLPLVEIILVDDGTDFRLSSLTPVKYSQLSQEETELLQNLMDMRVKLLE
jgi:hypothetical protein